MKKIIALTLVLLVIAGCGASTSKLGLGVGASVAATSATAEKDGKAQANVTIVAATFDAKGKVLNMYIDAVQPKAAVSATGEVTGPTDAIKTKNELGEAYGMKAASSIGKEVNEQYRALEQYAIGKDVNAVVGMKTYDKGDGNHTAVPDVEELKSSCTITVGEILECLNKAYANAK